MIPLLIALAVIICVLAALAASAIRILREYERAVVFRLGRLVGPKGPGLVLLVPMIDRMVRVDLRTMVLDISPQDLITRDNVQAKVNAYVSRVMPPVPPASSTPPAPSSKSSATSRPPRRSPRRRCARSSAGLSWTCWCPSASD